MRSQCFLAAAASAASQASGGAPSRARAWFARANSCSAASPWPRTPPRCAFPCNNPRHASAAQVTNPLAIGVIPLLNPNSRKVSLCSLLCPCDFFHTRRCRVSHPGVPHEQVFVRGVDARGVFVFAARVGYLEPRPPDALSSRSAAEGSAVVLAVVLSSSPNSFGLNCSLFHFPQTGCPILAASLFLPLAWVEAS